MCVCVCVRVASKSALGALRLGVNTDKTVVRSFPFIAVRMAA